MAHADDPGLRSRHEILSEVAFILARGYLRHRHARCLEAARDAQNGDVGQAEESGQITENRVGSEYWYASCKLVGVLVLCYPPCHG